MPEASSSSTAAPSGLPFLVLFPAQHAVHTPGSLVQGEVHVDEDACRRDGVSNVSVEVICKQSAVYYKYYGGDVHDRRQRTSILYQDGLQIWSGSPADGAADGEKTHVDEASGSGRRFSRLLSSVSRSKGKDKERALDSQQDVAVSHFTAVTSYPFAFLLPSGPNDLPPTFEGGYRAKSFVTEGEHKGKKGKMSQTHSVGYTRWFVKVTAKREGMFKSDRKQVHLFLYSHALTTPPSAIPPPFPPTGPDGLAPTRPGPAEGWKTWSAMQTRREGLLSRKGLILVQLAIPELPSYPSPQNIPFHLSVLLLSPPLSSSSSASSAAALASALKTTVRAEDLQLELVRCAWVRAGGAEQTQTQSAGNVIQDGSRRCWTGERRVFEEGEWEVLDPVVGDDDEDENGEKEEGPPPTGSWRVGQECIVVGTLRFPVGPSFSRGLDPKGHLACSYYLNAALPLKRTLSSTTFLKAVPQPADASTPGLRISTCFPDGDGSAPGLAAEADDWGLPGYFDIVGGENDGWADTKDEKEK